MSMGQNKKLNFLLLKNTILSLIPAILIMVVILCCMRYFHLLNNLDFYSVERPSELQQLYESGITNVEMTFPQLHEMGYDYQLDGKKTGSYYYAWVDGKFMIVLIKSEEPVISDYVVQGQLKEDAAVYSYILSQCAESAGMDTKQLEKMSYRYIISEVDYPKTFYRIVKIALYLAFAMIALSILELIVCIFCPWLHPQIRRIKGVSDKRLLVRDINRQLHDALLYENKNYLITKKYFVVCSGLRTDIILLRDIDVVSRHKERKRIVPWRAEHPVYKLILSTANGRIYEYDFRNETIINDMLPYLSRSGSKKR